MDKERERGRREREGDGELRTARATARETPKMALAPNLDLVSAKKEKKIFTK